MSRSANVLIETPASPASHIHHPSRHSKEANERDTAAPTVPLRDFSEAVDVSEDDDSFSEGIDVNEDVDAMVDTSHDISDGVITAEVLSRHHDLGILTMYRDNMTVRFDTPYIFFTFFRWSQTVLCGFRSRTIENSYQEWMIMSRRVGLPFFFLCTITSAVYLSEMYNVDTALASVAFVVSVRFQHLLSWECTQHLCTSVLPGTLSVYLFFTTYTSGHLSTDDHITEPSIFAANTAVFVLAAPLTATTISSNWFALVGMVVVHGVLLVTSPHFEGTHIWMNFVTGGVMNLIFSLFILIQSRLAYVQMVHAADLAETKLHAQKSLLVAEQQLLVEQLQRLKLQIQNVANVDLVNVRTRPVQRAAMECFAMQGEEHHSSLETAAPEMPCIKVTIYLSMCMLHVLHV